jgi:enoyl-CoA hydratase/carnithine racemase
VSAAAGLVVRYDGGALSVTLNRPASRNALGLDLVNAFIDGVDEAAARGVHSLILDGEGPAFCAGLDLGDADARRDADFVLLLVRIETLLQQIHRAPFQTLALAHGAAFGAGADLLAACRHRVATADLKIAFPGVRFGVFLGTRRLAARVGADAAERILGDGARLTGQDARGLGLVTEVAPQQGWAAIRERFVARGEAIEPYVGRRLGRLVSNDTGDADMADLVRSASRPGLAQRIASYVASLKKR